MLPLLVEPALELRNFRQVQAGEQPAPAQLQSLFGPSRVEGSGEGTGITPERLLAELQLLLASRHDDLGTESVPQRMKGLP